METTHTPLQIQLLDTQKKRHRREIHFPNPSFLLSKSKKNWGVHSRKLTYSPLKMVVGRRSFPFEMAYFQGAFNGC